MPTKRLGTNVDGGGGVCGFFCVCVCGFFNPRKLKCIWKEKSLQLDRGKPHGVPGI